jgi:maltooligosyltrehalose trehalohydrolase
VKTASQNRTYGASLKGDHVEFRVWAPFPNQLFLRLTAAGSVEQDVPMQRDGEDFVATAPASIGDRYTYVFPDGSAIPDPVSRSLPDGVQGPTEIVDPNAFQWTDSAWRGRELRDYVIYELHIGTFTPEGTFDSAISKIEYLKQLGVTVVEIMPVAACPGTRNWGYDGVSPYAVQDNYGGPEGLRRFVDAAHRVGLAVMLDVVYNHLGPEGNYLPKFAPYFTAQHNTPWGDAVNYDNAGSENVRRYVIENARYWIREYHIDGLRLDAVQTIQDDSVQNIVAQIREQVQQLAEELGRTVCVTAETDQNDSRYTKPAHDGGYGLDAVWSDDFHHALHSFFTGERQGYYQDFGDPQQIARALRDGYVFQGELFTFWNRPRGTSARGVPLPANVICTQNHDQIGNRAKGERLTALIPRGARKVAAAYLLLAPHTPLLFMGQEYDETAPFQFFADFQDPALKKAVSEGRRSEFKDFDFAEVPDPEDPATFQRSTLTWADAPDNREMLEWYKRLLQLRQQYVTNHPRTADAQFANGILSVELPAKDPHLVAEASLQPGASLPRIKSGWHEVLRSAEDGYELSVFVR